MTDDPHVLFLGTLDWPPNGDAVNFFLQDVWPAVKRDVPAARLTIVGRGGSALERRWVHLTLRDHPNVATQSIGEEPNRRVVVLPRNP